MMCIKAMVKIGRSDLMLENVEIIDTQNMIDIIGKFPVRSQEEIDNYKRMEEQDRINNFHKNCGLDSEFFGATIDFEKYSLEVKKSLKQFVEKVKNGEGGFLIINGNVGTGKTSAAAAVMNELLIGTYLDMLELDLKLDSVSRFNSQESKENYMHKLASCRLLVLDEVGRFPYRKQEEQPILFYLMNKRFQNKRPTIICTNMTSKEFADFVGQALIDRIRSNRIRIELNGSSLR